MTVRILAPEVRDQIAAGEVVERPSSVVKELLENALDAGAKRLSVELEEGGRGLIRVADDGCGMGPNDLALCVERFATSKLENSADLESVATLGFRGEALPSIASVSRMAITSRQHGSDSGWCLAVEGGRRQEPRPAGGAPGTAVEVRDLFFNVPARRKFLKSARTELNRALKAVGELALVRPGVAFRVEHGGRRLLEVAGAERLADRVAALNGSKLVESLAEAQAELGSGARAAGLVGLPTEHRSTASDVHVFVGGRPVRDRTAIAAVGAAYTGLLPLRRYPVVFLFLEFPPGAVDFNVHPTKAEVRFARPGDVFTLVERAVRGALSRAELAAAGGFEGYGRNDRPGEARSARAAEPAPRSDRARPAARRSRPRFTEPVVRRDRPRQESLDLWGAAPEPAPEPAVRTGPETPPAPPAPDREETPPASGSGARAPDSARPVPGEAAWRYVGQVLDGYLLAESAQGLLVVDQHALHERLIYEELCAAGSERPAASQGLLVPVTVEAGRRQAEVLRAAREELQAAGFDIEEFGGSGFLVRALPAAVKLSDVAGYVLELAEQLVDDRATGAGKLDRQRVLAAAACRAAVKAGERLSPRAAEDLLRRARAPRPGASLHTCPHGRPTSFLVDREELARRVGR
jgi:DNA mismatch repair protein MutL